MSVRDKIVKGITKVSGTFVVTRQTSTDELDYTGSPATNSNYGLKNTETTSVSNIVMYCQHISDNDAINGNYIKYENRGYTVRGLLKIKSLTTLQEKDIITYSDGYKYEVFEKTDRNLPNLNGSYEYAYTQALAHKLEVQ